MDAQNEMPTCRFLSRKHKAIGWIVAGLLALLSLFLIPSQVLLLSGECE